MGHLIRRITPVLLLTSVFLYLTVGIVFAAGSQYWYLTKEWVGIQAQDGTIHSTDNMMTKIPPTVTFGLNHGNNDNKDLPNYLSAVRMLNTAGTGTLISIELLVNDTTPNGNVHIGMYTEIELLSQNAE